MGQPTSSIRHQQFLLMGAGSGGESGPSPVSDEAYDAATWNGVTGVAPSKNAVRNKIESLSGGGLTSPQIQSLVSIRF